MYHESKINKQQQQTKSFFKKAANDWQSKAKNLGYGIINDRHQAVHKTLKLYPKGSSLLDIGCGTGQLAIEASKIGYKASGIDFADEMISIAKNNNVKKKHQHFLRLVRYLIISLIENLML